MNGSNENIIPYFNGLVLVTGAAGFIGSHVVEYLCAQNVQVRCFVKPSSDLKYIQHLPFELSFGDICDFDSLKNAMQGVCAVIHIAALSKDWGAYADFYNINVQGTLNVLKACKAHKIDNVIVTGSIASYGEENNASVKDETFPFNAHYPYFADRLFSCGMNYYRDSKAEATRKAIEYAQKYNLNATIIEPAFVYGEREFNSGFYEYLKTIKSNIPFFIGSRRNNFHVVYARDLARAYYLSLSKGLHGVNRIIIGNAKSDKMHKVFGAFCKAIEKKQPLNMPKVLVYPFAFIMEWVYTIFKSSTPPLLTRGRVNMFYDNIEYATQKAEQLIDFSTEYSLEDGVRQTVNWYKENNLI